MRVPLLLKEIETRTVDALEKTSIQTIIQEQEHSLRELDDKMRWLKNFERLLEIQRNIQWPSVLDMDPKVYVPEVQFEGVVFCVFSLINDTFFLGCSVFEKSARQTALRAADCQSTAADCTGGAANGA